MSSLRNKIIEVAIAEATPQPYGKVSDMVKDAEGNRAGWRTLKAYFDEAILDWSEAHWKETGKIKPAGESEWREITFLDGVKKPNYRVPQAIYEKSGGKWAKTGYRDSGVSWCGIFATWVLKKANLNVYWSSATGITGSHVKQIFANEGYQPGDVLIFRGETNHHAIFVAENHRIYGGDGSLDTINGNSSFQSIERHSRYLPSQIQGYYRIVA